MWVKVFVAEPLLNILSVASVQHGHTGKLWHDAISSHQALLDALDVLVKHSSWRDSIVALLMWPVLWSLRHLGASWLWLWARQGLRMRCGGMDNNHTESMLGYACTPPLSGGTHTTAKLVGDGVACELQSAATISLSACIARPACHHCPLERTSPQH